MRFILIFIFNIFVSLTVQGQISDIEVRGNTVYIFDEKNQLLSTKNISNCELVGNSSTVYVLRRCCNHLYIYDGQSMMVGHISISEDSKVCGVYNKTLNICVGNYIKTYGILGNFKSQKYSSYEPR
jgi:hypothetical protein